MLERWASPAKASGRRGALESIVLPGRPCVTVIFRLFALLTIATTGSHVKIQSFVVR